MLETRTRQVEVAAIYQTSYRQEWIAAEYTSVCRREYHPATFRSVCREVTDEPQYREISVQKYVPPVVKCEKVVRCTPDGKGGFTSVEDVKLVIVSQGRFEMQTERKLIAEGGSRMIFETVQDKPGLKPNPRAAACWMVRPRFLPHPTSPASPFSFFSPTSSARFSITSSYGWSEPP